MEEYTITKAVDADAEDILAIQKTAYLIEAERYNDFNLPPLRQTLEELRTDIGAQTVLKAADSGGAIIGSVRGRADGGTCFVARLSVRPDRQNRGIATALMLELEKHFPQCSRFELFTGHRSEKNLHLYAKLGYKPFKTVPESDNIQLVFLEKIVVRAD